MNKKRLLAILYLLKNYSDDDHPLHINKLFNLLASEFNIDDVDRKTIYDDIKVLNSFPDIKIKTSRSGYSLEALPFELAELKILRDAVASLKNIDLQTYQKINQKLQSLSSFKQNELLENLDYNITNPNAKHLIYFMQIILKAIEKNECLNIRIKNRQSLIKPYFLYRFNDYYYLFYTYSESDKLYRVRFDRISQVDYSGINFKPSISKTKILADIAESSNLFHNSDVKKVKLAILEPDDELYFRLQDDFQSIIINEDKKLAYLKISINDVFFARLAAYKTKIKILEPQDVILKYQDYLNAILAIIYPRTC